MGASRQIFVSQAALIVMDVYSSSTATETSVYLSLPMFNVFFQLSLNRSYLLSYGVPSYLRIVSRCISRK